MRTLKELYTIIAEEHLKRKQRGLCFVILQAYWDNIITFEERLELETDFKKRRPNIFSKEFYNAPYNRFESEDSYWWELTIAGDIQRDKFLQKIIKKLK